MARPVVGIISNLHLINETYEVDAVSKMVSHAVCEVSGAATIALPTGGKLVSVEEAMQICDGFVFPGGRANVYPEEYGHEPSEAHGTFDRDRDGLALPLMRACVEAGMPIFAICRGFQELAVAFGSTLHPEIRELPGRMNHRMPPDGTLEEKFALRHKVHFTPGGVFARLMGADEVMTNTLHGQGIIEPGPRIVIDGRAPDDTPEAIYVDGAPGFALGVQWHPEYRAAEDPVSRKLFRAFGKATADWAAGLRPGSCQKIAS